MTNEEEFRALLSALAAADDPLAVLSERSVGEPAADDLPSFRLALEGHGLASWRFVLVVRLPELELGFNLPLAGAFSPESAHARDRENVRTLCRLAVVALDAPQDLPDGAVRLTASYGPIEETPVWRLESADGTALREGTDWPGLLDLLAGAPAFASDNFIRI